MLKIVIVLFSLVVVVFGALFFLQAKLLFFPVLLDKNFTFNFELPFEEKFIAYGKNQFIHGLLFKSPSPRARILYFHGNGGAVDSWGYSAQEIAKRLDCEVLVVDYPGYGKSSGSVPKSEKGLIESARAALKEISIDSKLPLIIYGRSLGSGIASALAAHSAVQGLILESPYTSIKNMASLLFPLVPSFLVRYDLDNNKNLEAVSAPILILHGTGDTVIPYSHSVRLHEAYPNVNFITMVNGGHNDLSDFPEYWGEIEKFLNLRQ